MIHGFLTCGPSLIPTFSHVFSRASITVLQPSLYCVSLYLVFTFYDNGPSFDCVLSPSNLATTVFFCFEPVLPQPHQFISHPVSSKGKCLLCLLSTVDNNLFSFPFIFLVHNEAGSESCGKTSDFSEILTQPPLSSLLCTSCFA